MKERPILFSAPMVRAILDGRKTQTRRAVNARKTDINRFSQVYNPVRQTGIRTYDSSTYRFSGDGDEHYLSCPYGVPGDRLWVRETWGHFNASCMTDPVYRSPASCFYRADESSDGSRPISGRWRPSIHMPRWASRINLEITGIRVERLNDISEADAFAEGVEEIVGMIDREVTFMSKRIGCCPEDAKTHFACLWESINGPKSWSANPFVWVVELKKLEAT